MVETPLTCVLERIDAPNLAAVEPVFATSSSRIVIDMRRVVLTTPEGVARLAHLVRLAQRRQVAVEIVAATPVVRRALVASGIQHLVTLA